ncbi:dihydrofolate reductase [Sphingobacterium sp. DK4209]|uniref:Dihydrofolate reductase n=1 Tax=Sphingobacterium zhuxiongii TaxID=2662364 RepID=A0A5Q0QGD2_9SPHI|nr:MULTISPECIES: dihydrofolate reductase family protein [unclassified Sphingobacterium]MVZ67025.1 dihydrofolate reductase [Sphingobacterium sp. DK4209]QGA26682.1 dihydrofolate reductase [Sphingobacterium sp. dk4302]
MSKIIVDCAISLDGYFAGEQRGPGNPMGGVSGRLHAWMMKEKAFWRRIKMEGGTEDGKDGELINEVFDRTGAYIMGKRMFEEGEVSWAEDLYEADVYVLTHEKRDPWIQKGSTRFFFINDGIESALEKARASANGKDIRIQGGAITIQEFLNAGLIDELYLHITPIFIGKGIRLFEGMDPDKYEIQVLQVDSTELTTHMHYRLIRK